MSYNHYQDQQHIHPIIDQSLLKNWSKEEEVLPSSLHLLPNELIIHIFSFVDVFGLCGTVTGVCSMFHRLAREDMLWRPLCVKDWGSYRSALQFTEWHSLYMERATIENNWMQGRYTVRTLDGHQGAVRCIQASGGTLVSGSEDKTIRVWDLQTSECRTTIAETKRLRCLQFDSEKEVLLSSTTDANVKVWSLTRSQPLTVLEEGTNRGGLSCLRFIAPVVICGALDGALRFWDLGIGQCFSRFASGHDSLRGLFYQDSLLVTAGTERHMRLWDMRISMGLGCVGLMESSPSGSYCVQFDVQTGMIVAGSKGCVSIGDLRTQKSVVMLKGHSDVVNCLQFARRRLVTGSMDSTIKIWDLSSLECVQTFEEHSSWIWNLQFDVSGLVTASGDNTIKLWDFGT